MSLVQQPQETERIAKAEATSEVMMRNIGTEVVD
jgi:hypothetical protein